MMRRCVVALAFLYGLLPAIAAGQDLQQQLQAQYSDKVLFLRHSFLSSSQEYDSEGTPLGSKEEGPWPFFASIKVKKVVLKGTKLQLEGNHIVFGYELRSTHLVLLHDSAPVKVTVRLNSELTSMDQAAAVLSRIFAANQEEALNSAPPQWRPDVAKQSPGIHNGKDGTQIAGNDANGGKTEEENVSPLSPDITPPRIISTRTPEFSGKALQYHFEGVVGLNATIDTKGHVGNVSVVHPLGLGLDEQAIRNVKGWTFTPAKRNGQPVPVTMYFEVDFHL